MVNSEIMLSKVNVTKISEIRVLMKRALKQNKVQSMAPVRESARLRPSVTGHTAAECPAQAGNAFRRRVSRRRIDNICLEDISLHRAEGTTRRRNCNEVSCQTPTLLSPSGYTNRKNAFAAGLRHFPGSCTRLLMVEVFQTSAQVHHNPLF